MASITRELNRRVGVLVDRAGHIEAVAGSQLCHEQRVMQLVVGRGRKRA